MHSMPGFRRQGTQPCRCACQSDGWGDTSDSGRRRAAPASPGAQGVGEMYRSGCDAGLERVHTRTCSVKGVVGARFTRVRTAERSAPPAVDRACFNMTIGVCGRAACPLPPCDGPRPSVSMRAVLSQLASRASAAPVASSLGAELRSTWGVASRGSLEPGLSLAPRTALPGGSCTRRQTDNAVPRPAGAYPVPSANLRDMRDLPRRAQRDLPRPRRNGRSCTTIVSTG